MLISQQISLLHALSICLAALLLIPSMSEAYNTFMVDTALLQSAEYVSLHALDQ